MQEVVEVVEIVEVGNNGTANTGGGGGGGGWIHHLMCRWSGGSGIVIIRYKFQ